VFYSHSTVRLKSCKKNNNNAEKNCSSTMKFQNVLNDSPVDRILKIFKRASELPPSSYQNACRREVLQMGTDV
jgi:hypothetical protein